MIVLTRHLTLPLGRKDHAEDFVHGQVAKLLIQAMNDPSLAPEDHVSIDLGRWTEDLPRDIAVRTIRVFVAERMKDLEVVLRGGPENGRIVQIPRQITNIQYADMQPAAFGGSQRLDTDHYHVYRRNGDGTFSYEGQR